MDLYSIGRRVREIRKERGLTQERLAEEANLSVVCVSNIERGQKKASLDSVIRISAVLGVTVDTLIYGSCLTDQKAYYPEVHELLDGCTLRERRILFEVSKVLKMALRNDGWAA